MWDGNDTASVACVADREGWHRLTRQEITTSPCSVVPAVTCAWRAGIHDRDLPVARHASSSMIPFPARF